jgi:hypothetical protein
MFHNILLVYQIKEDEMGGACISRMSETRVAHKVLVGNLKRKNHSEDLVIDGRIYYN